MYDVVIRTDYRNEYKFEELSEIRMRYLHYHKIDENNNITFVMTLKHPEDLISATLHRAKISNLSECVNLQNLYSCNNTYAVQDIEHMHRLKRVHSTNDRYVSSKRTLIEDLFLNNKLEYVNFVDAIFTNTPMRPLILAENIENLRFLHVF